MELIFKKIGVFAKIHDVQIQPLLQRLLSFLRQFNCEVFLELETSTILKEKHQCLAISKEDMGTTCNLIIVMGGDGSLLNAARSIVDNDIPVLGIHRGRLGFLTDISPNKMESTLNAILHGKYINEYRSLLQTSSLSQKFVQTALNDVVFYHGDVARMIEFELFINNKYIFHQRSDGMIISTPTGSTAYALSGGGPILDPTLDAISMVPMFPHTLSTRPIVINEACEVKIILASDNSSIAKISCDGQVHFTITPGETLTIRRHPHKLRLIHPINYNYYHVLREKLGWNINASSDRCSKSNY